MPAPDMLSEKREGVMERFGAIFYRVDGLDQIDVGGTVFLKAETLNDAQDEALALNRPEGANFVKITDNGLVVDYLGFGL